MNWGQDSHGRGEQARRHRRVATVLTVINVVLLVAALLNLLLDGGTTTAEPWGQLGIAVMFVAVGAILTLHRPENRVSWVEAVTGTALALLAADGLESLVPQGVSTALGVMGGWVWAVALSLPATYGLLWFPDGKTPGRRWRWLERMLGVGYAVILATATVLPFGVTEVGAPGENPLALHGLADVLEVIYLAALVGIVLGVGACITSLVLRFVRSQGVERAQLKWLVWSASIGIAAYLAAGLLERPLVVWVTTYGALMLVAASIGIAVLRYRLYEIDRVISRTVTYTLVLGVLVAVYAGLVVGLRGLLSPVTGESDIAVAGSTLVVAALFGPVLRRVRGVVDRRFNRSRADAVLVTESFAARLRDQVDLDALASDLVSTVGASLEPSGVSLWLRGEAK